MVRVLATPALIAEFESVRAYRAPSADHERLDLFRTLLDRLEEAHSALFNAFLASDAEAFAAAEVAFRKYTDLLRKMQHTSTNTELRAMGLDFRR